MVVYLDLVAVLNFLVDLLLLLATNRIAGFPMAIGRAAAAAALGAIYAVGCALNGFAFLGNLPWRLICLLLMSAIAFGLSRGAWQRCILFVFLSMALGGIALGIGSGGFWAIVMGAVGTLLLCVVGFCGRDPRQKYVQVLICHGNHRLRLTALLDTGNTLRDPISGAPVLVADATVAEKLAGLSPSALADPVAALAGSVNRGLRLIPYHAVGQPKGLLLGMQVDELFIDGKKQKMIVAFAPQLIGQGKVYQALAGGRVA